MPSFNVQTKPDVIHIGGLRPALLRAGRLVTETVLVPTVLLIVLLHTAGLAAGFGAVLGWCALTVVVRWIRGRRLPGTLVVCAGMLSARACVALALSSAAVYLMQPIVGSIFMALMFLGSAVIGRPITMRLARDFVHLPAHLSNHRGVRRIFTQTAALWGLGRLVDAGISIASLHLGVTLALLSRGLLSGGLTALMALVCAAWGFRSLRRLPDVHFRFAAAPASERNPRFDHSPIGRRPDVLEECGGTRPIWSRRS
jgi:hypothetical protein